jgi:PAS domain S-box-containing protein
MGKLGCKAPVKQLVPMFFSLAAITSLELKSVIIRDPLVVVPETSAIEAIAQMGRVGANYLLVGAKDRVLGIFTAGDAIEFIARQRTDSSQPAPPIGELIRPGMITLGESAFTDALQVIELLRQHHALHLTILDDRDRLVGIVTHESLHRIIWSKLADALAEAPKSAPVEHTLIPAIIRQPLKTEFTGRQQMEEALHCSEARWQFALEGAGDGLWDWNIETDQVFYSPQWKAMLGYTVEEISDRVEEWSSRVHPEDKADCHSALQDHFNKKTATYQVEHRVAMKNGQYLWILARGKVIEWNSAGQPWRMIGTHTDISDRKQAENSLQSLIRGTAATTGENFFPAVVDHISQALGVSWAMVSELVDGQLHVKACQSYGDAYPNFVYPLADGPCELTIENNSYYCDESVQTKFPKDELLVQAGVDSYLGVALTNSQGQKIGILCVFGHQHIQDPRRAESLLLVFAARAAAELERQQATKQLESFNQDLEQKVLERTAALQASEAKFRNLIEGMNDLVWSSNLHGEFTYLSPQFETLFSWQPSEWIGQPFMELIHPDDRLLVTTDYQEILKLANNPSYPEFRIRHKHGHYCWVQISARPTIAESGEAIGAQGILSDITARKHAELTIRQQAERETLLREMTQRIRQSLKLQTIFETACQDTQQLLQADRVGIFKFAPNSNCEEGSFVAESLPTEFPSVISVRVQDRCFGNNFSAIYAQGKVYAIDDIYSNGLSTCHTNILSKFAVRANLIVPLTCGDVLWGLLCIHQCSGTRHWEQNDINVAQQISTQLAIAIHQADLFEQLQQELQERQEAQDQLTERNEQLAVFNDELARATRLKDEFLANMSHELRTPLNAILGLTEGLSEHVFGSVSDRQIKALATIERSGSHLLELINDILDVAKIESGQLQLDCTVTSVNNLCSSSLAFIKQQALQKQICLETKISPDLPNLLVDERRVRQVLINLLSNAVKFTPEGGKITLEVGHNQYIETDVGGATPRKYIRISVIDNGIGIDPKNIGKLFQPFIQIDSALNRKYDGTGLGLALVKRIVELHGGQVNLMSEVGVGSCFSIDLPCTTTPLSAKELTILPLANEPTPPTRIGAASILIAEDNEANIITISSYLGVKGYQLLVARNGHEAIELAQSSLPNLILMDIQMPGMDGIEAIQKIRQNPELSSIPIIAITALAMKGDREKCLTAGANDYISKPIKLKQLNETIQHFLPLQTLVT